MIFFTSAKRVMAVLTIASVPAVVFAYDFKEGNLCFATLPTRSAIFMFLSRASVYTTAPPIGEASKSRASTALTVSKPSRRQKLWKGTTT